MTAVPSRASTLAERRTQVSLICARCRREWFMEMTPPVLIVQPNRAMDVATSSPVATAEEAQAEDRRESRELPRQRMRVGLCGLLKSTDRTETVTVLYSLDARRRAGRLRLTDPGSVWPPWLVPRSRLWLFGYDGLPLRIRTTLVKLRREGFKEDEQFAEFVVPPVTQ